MALTGQNILGFDLSAKGTNSFFAINPRTNKELSTKYYQATKDEIDEAVKLAESAFSIYRNKSGAEKADFLDTIAKEILELDANLITICQQETGLPEGRLIGERGRTIGQLKLFAQLLREGSWVDARIDFADANRQPIPKPDTRQMQIPIGPVGIFGSSNFPLAFSVAGGDTASALAAGCTVIIKAHPAHPGTSELIGTAITKAAQKCGMPNGTFSLVQGPSVDVGLTLVKNPLIKAIGFTGSFKGGKALFDEANKREEPIPVYAEMGSTNPVFILQEKLKQETKQIAEGINNSVQLGVGQFCTNPGITVVTKSKDSEAFENILSEEVKNSISGTMLTDNIQKTYNLGLDKLKSKSVVTKVSKGEKAEGESQGIPEVLKVSGKDFLLDRELEKEIFGPSTLLIQTENAQERLEIAKGLEGHLTATVFGTENDLKENIELLKILELKVGRLLLNSYPTGVEVCYSMVHGGPFPATTDSRMTSVGTSAITRFTRPICYQNFSEFLLPTELKTNNPLDISRIENGTRQ
jgi:alpha-ketoglutaric semialdehyde dehydrogenase